MSWVVLNSEGKVVQRVNKLTPQTIVPPGGWCARYEPPAFDRETQVCRPVLPVPYLQDLVTFTVTNKSLTPEQMGEIGARRLVALSRKLEDVVRARMAAWVKTRGYDSLVDACKYIGGTNATWDAEGRAVRDVATGVWETAYVLQAEVFAGQRQPPQGLADIVPDLPALAWPDGEVFPWIGG